MCVFLCLYVFHVLFLWLFCVSNETYQAKVWIGMSEELGKIWEGLRKGKTIRIYYMKNVFSNKKRKEKVNEKKITEERKS